MAAIIALGSCSRAPVGSSQFVTVALRSQARPIAVGSLLAVPMRCMSASIPYPKVPFRKKLLDRKKENVVHRIRSWNSPSMLAKHIRAGERRARELGVMEDLAAFDEAAAAFPKPPALVAAA